MQGSEWRGAVAATVANRGELRAPSCDTCPFSRNLGLELPTLADTAHLLRLQAGASLRSALLNLSLPLQVWINDRLGSAGAGAALPCGRLHSWFQTLWQLSPSFA